jgi:hypothetical protein
VPALRRSHRRFQDPPPDLLGNSLVLRKTLQRTLNPVKGLLRDGHIFRILEALYVRLLQDRSERNRSPRAQLLRLTAVLDDA